jgi:methionyl-tRNA synthetase
MKEIVVATPKKKTSKKRTAKKARSSNRARVAKAAVAKKRVGKSKRVAKKVAKKQVAKTSRKTVKKVVKKATKKPLVAKKAPKKAGKKAAKKAAKKSATKGKSEKRSSTSRQPHAVEKTRRTKAGVTADLVAAPANTAARNSFYITTAIAYPNGIPHIGHAYEAIATDALARFQRLDGKDVFFLTGTDEHGLKMIQTAQGEGMTPLDLATRNAARFKEMDQRLNVSFDRFIRTSEPAHHRSVQEIWKRMQAAGDIYIDAYSGWYSVRDEAYYAEDETTVG